jgi:hypothetical protein
MPSTLLTHPTATATSANDDAIPTDVTGGTAPLTTVAGSTGARETQRPGGLTAAAQWSARTLPSRLNWEWMCLCASAGSDVAVRDWAAPGRGRPGLLQLVGLEGLHAIVPLLQGPSLTLGARDAILLGLLERAQDGDGLAGRVVLQAMLPAVVRLARQVTGRPDVSGDQDEAFALVLAALWQTIATYPVARRPAKVPANLYLDTLAIVRRGHTSGSHRTRVFLERPFADIQTAGDPGQLDADLDDPAGPVDAQLFTVLAWAVRSAVLLLDEAQLLIRVYGLDGGPADAGPAVAAEIGLSWPALRQRCHRLARRVGHAAVAAGIDSTVQRHTFLNAA